MATIGLLFVRKRSRPRQSRRELVFFEALAAGSGSAVAMSANVDYFFWAIDTNAKKECF
jgi:hypothetical protein